MGERLEDIGEFGWIGRLRARLAPAAGVEIGPGDDAALLRVGTQPLLATTDAMVEGIHFDLGISAPADVGYKALASNLSDIAAMGGTPRYALAALGAPGTTLAATLDGIADGLLEAAGAHGVALVGGDLVASDRILLSVTVVGEPGGVPPVRRSGARPGDALLVTGALGAAAAGLALLRAASTGDEAAAGMLDRHPSLATAHRRGRARIAEGAAAAAAGATAMIDVSDGLAADAGHLCEESGVGIEIAEASVPVAPGVSEAGALMGVDPIAWALGGGEDYELAITVAGEHVASLAHALAPTPVTRIGRVTAEGRRLLRPDGGTEPLRAHGWDHFSERQ